MILLLYSQKVISTVFFNEKLLYNNYLLWLELMFNFFAKISIIKLFNNTNICLLKLFHQYLESFESSGLHGLLYVFFIFFKLSFKLGLFRCLESQKLLTIHQKIQESLSSSYVYSKFKLVGK